MSERSNLHCTGTKFSIKDFSRKCDKIRNSFTEEILNGKLQFLYSADNVLVPLLLIETHFAG